MLPYFLNEGLCVSKREMDNVRRCSLWVETLRHNSHPCYCGEKSDVKLLPGHKVTDFTEVKQVFPEEGPCSLGRAKKAKMESLGAGESSAYRRMPCVDALKEHDAWILDIDLDFFATSNPFKGNFTEVIYNIVQRDNMPCTNHNVHAKMHLCLCVCDSKHAFVFMCVVTPNMHLCLCVVIPNMHSCLCVL